MPTLPFEVDSALLKELGERLIGKPHVALAELVKNSYDADANEVSISFEPQQDRIEVHDDGHGMTFDEFRKFWMRIGTPHKAGQRHSRHLDRPLTGSKGVGRLSVQFLADNCTIRSVAEERSASWIQASVDWSQAVSAGELTKAEVEYHVRRSNPPMEKGTSISLTGLKDSWEADSIRQLAREIWWLRPPFRATSAKEEKRRFDISLHSSEVELERVFNQQLHAIMGIWTARIVGACRDGEVQLAIEFPGEAPVKHSYEVAELPRNGGTYRTEGEENKVNLSRCNFEIRVFKLEHRQPHGISVNDAREYFEQFGGVHVYDAGFHLPHYGDPKNDWLQVEFDAAHRRTLSRLLPESLQVRRGLQKLPTVGRIFGVANVDTSRERGLRILITRDRLAETTAFHDLRDVVRYGLDLYAMERTRRDTEREFANRPVEPTTRKFQRVEEALADHKEEIPEQVYEELRDNIRDATLAAADEQEAFVQHVGLLGALATAGIATVAYQHELKKQFGGIQRIAQEIRDVHTHDAALNKTLAELAGDLQSWLERARATNALFAPLADTENTQVRTRLKASSVIQEVKRQTEVLARGIEVGVTGVPDDLRLPAGSFVEWTAILQNVFINAFNAVLDSDKRILKVTSRVQRSRKELLVQDTGKGVKLDTAEELFKPFVRRLEVSQERRSLGYGGTGLGLTIVRLVADSLGCKVVFVVPEDGFKTAFSISWKDSE